MSQALEVAYSLALDATVYMGPYGPLELGNNISAPLRAIDMSYSRGESGPFDPIKSSHLIVLWAGGRKMYRKEGYPDGEPSWGGADTSSCGD
jgi:hypothetical protein